jgi:hypothetical protein
MSCRITGWAGGATFREANREATTHTGPDAWTSADSNERQPNCPHPTRNPWHGGGRWTPISYPDPYPGLLPKSGFGSFGRGHLVTRGRGAVGRGGPASPRMFQPMVPRSKRWNTPGGGCRSWHAFGTQGRQRPLVAVTGRTRPDCEKLDSLSVFPQVRPHFEPCSAEGVGFEPTMTVTRHTGFQGRTVNRSDVASDLRKLWVGPSAGRLTGTADPI